MGDHKDYMRGEQEGYSGMSRGLPKNFAESVGRAAGESRRQRELERRRGTSEGTEAGEAMSPFAYLASSGAVVFVLLLLLVAFAKGIVVKLIVAGFAVAALFSVSRIRPRLGKLTPIYVGLLIGLLLGCLESIATGARLNLFNLSTFLFLGATFGSVPALIAVLRRR